VGRPPFQPNSGSLLPFQKFSYSVEKGTKIAKNAHDMINDESTLKQPQKVALCDF
jgi:hypothetical protein